MTFIHRIYIILLSALVIIIFVVLALKGYSFYIVSLNERFYQPDYAVLKPSGILGHGYGIIGSILMVLGVVLYSTRKRLRSLARLGILKYWLEFHIFLCTIGPILILFHTSFKFGGLVAISFWSMVAVFLSGVAGRFIYIQIPRSIEGNELNLGEIRDIRDKIGKNLSETHDLDAESIGIINDLTKKKVEKYYKSSLVRWFRNFSYDRKSIKKARSVLKEKGIPVSDRKHIISLVKQDISLNRKIERLATMQNLFKYWHVAHLPFAMVMLIIMVIHVAVTIVFGYRWIF